MVAFSAPLSGRLAATSHHHHHVTKIKHLLPPARHKRWAKESQTNPKLNKSSRAQSGTEHPWRLSVCVFFHSPLLVCFKGCLHVSMCMCTSNHPLPVQTRKKIALTAFATALVTTQKQHSTVSRAQPRHKRNSKTQTIRLSAVKNGWGCDFYFRLFGFFYPNVWPWPVSSCVVIRLWLPSSAFSFRVEPISILPVRCYFFSGVCVSSNTTPTPARSQNQSFPTPWDLSHARFGSTVLGRYHESHAPHCFFASLLLPA